jgi:hypothetical protein
MAENQTREPGVWSLVGELIADLVIHSEGAELFGEF